MQNERKYPQNGRKYPQNGRKSNFCNKWLFLDTVLLWHCWATFKWFPLVCRSSCGTELGTLDKEMLVLVCWDWGATPTSKALPVFSAIFDVLYRIFCPGVTISAIVIDGHWTYILGSPFLRLARVRVDGYPFHQLNFVGTRSFLTGN